MNKYLMRVTNYVVLASVLSMSCWAPAAGARMVSTEQASDSRAAQHDRDQLRALLERAEARKQLMARGVDAKAAQARIDALTDSEAASISRDIGRLPAGGDIDALGIMGGFFLEVFVVLLMAYTVGVIH